ncbi:hypothetical protein BC834DRAFT_968212 [Gloeopeniophorella convolvens]|nr:hypothetical protein BC834DRAFT_968212 [Gloeopeniophorella convolvens]
MTSAAAVSAATTKAATSTAAAPASTGTAVFVAAAQQRDNTMTRAFSGAETSSGECLAIDARSRNARENPPPTIAQGCGDSKGQTQDVPGAAL